MKCAVGMGMRGRALSLLGGVGRVASVLGPLLGGFVAGRTESRRAALMVRAELFIVAHCFASVFFVVNSSSTFLFVVVF